MLQERKVSDYFRRWIWSLLYVRNEAGAAQLDEKHFEKKKNVYWKKMYNQSHQCDNIFALLALPWQEPRERGVMKKSEDAHSAFIQNRQFRACLLHASNVAISTKPGKKTYILYLLIKIDHCWRELMEINGNITETPQTWRNNIIETVTWLSSSAVQFEN